MKTNLHNIVNAIRGLSAISGLIRSFCVISVISGLFLLAPLAPSESFAASCSRTLNWTGGWCSMCGGPVGNYACNPPQCNPCGAWGPRSFSDCVPAGNVVTRICATVYFGPCSSGGDFTIRLNGVYIAGKPYGSTICSCGSCTSWTGCRNTPCPSGFPGYVYGGTNTFSLTVDNGNSFCMSRVVITMTYAPAQPALPAVPTGPTNPCAGSVQTYSIASVSGATTYNWTVPSGWSINSGQGTTSISVTVGSTAGNVCVRAGNSCGWSSYRCRWITPQSAPAMPGSITGPGTPCIGTTQTYSISAVSGATSYTWTVPSGWSINSGQGTTSISVTVGSSSGNVCVRACNACGCSSFRCRSITVTPTPATPGAISGPASPCAGTTQTYSIGSVSGATSYQWTVPSGWSINSGQGTTSINVTVGSGSGNICVRACNGCGCSSFQCRFINPGSAPSQPSSITGSSPVCSGSTQTYSIPPVGGATGYNWTVPGGWSIISGQNTTSISATAGSSGNVCVTAINSCGSSTPRCRFITVSNITFTASATPETCGGACDGSVTTTAPSGGASPYTWSWSNGCTSQTCGSLCPGFYTVTVTDANGCTTTGSATVAAGTPVVAGFTYNGNQCPGNSFNFTNTGTMGVTYAWTFPSGSPATSTAENPSGITWSIPGTYTITQTVTSGACNDVATLNIVVYSEPAVTVTGTNVQCFGDCDGTANAAVSGGQSPYNYSWSPAPGSGQGTPNVTGLCPATYTVTVTDANGCVGTDNIAISQPSAALSTTNNSPQNLLCNGDCNEIATVTPSGGTVGYTYQWDGGTGWQTTQSATGLCVGTYNVTVTDANGCTTTDAVTVAEPAAMILTTASDSATCGSSDGQVSVVVGGGTPTYTYSWSPLGCVSAVCPGLPAGTYTITVTDANGCTETATATIFTTAGVIAVASITSNYNGQDVTCNGVCDGSADVTVSGGVPSFTYVWSPAPGGGGQGTDNVTGLCAGTIYTITVTDGNGCIASDAVTLTAPPVLSAAITASTEPSCNGVCDGNATVTASGGTGAYTYSWFPAGGTGATSTSVFCDATLYIVTVTDVNGCSTTANITLGEPTALTIASIVGTDVSCNGGSDGAADLTVTGGTGAYTFAWTGPGGFTSTAEDIINIIAGTYDVTVTDFNGCITSGSVIIDEPTAILLTTNTTDAYCALPNGEACVIASGGTGAYTYSWDSSPIQTTDCATGLPGVITYNVTVTDANGCIATSIATVNDLPPFTVTITVDNNVSGFGICDGMATANPSGGFSPYTYLWNDPLAQTTQQADSLCVGTWCVDVTDFAGCVSTDCITITEPPALEDTIVGTNVSCNGGCSGVCDGEAELTVIGGVLPYSFLWTGPCGFTAATEDIIGLCAGWYIVVITDANSITQVDSIEITEPPVLAAAMSGNDAVCNGVCDGDATATVTGGTPPYTYLWTPGGQTTLTATGLCAGIYDVTVTDTNGCIVTNTYTINEPLPVIVSTTVQNATCGQSDGSATASVTNGVSPFTYLWSTVPPQTGSTATGLPSGTYTVIVTDTDGCIDSAQAGVGDDAGATAIITDSTDVSCYGSCDGTATVFASGGTAPYTYNWVPTLQTTPVALGLCAGTYCVEVTDATGCITNVCVNINEPNLLVGTTSVLANPNCNGNCTGIAQVTVTGGTAPYTYQWDDDSLQTIFTPTGLCAGTYNVVITDANGCIAIATVTLIEPLPLTLSISVVDNSCAGACDGSASVIPTGGTPPYTYSWLLGVTVISSTQIADSLCANTYTVQVVDANGCGASSSVIITEPTPLIVFISNFGDVDCNGNCNGFATLGHTGGTSAYTYSWSDGQANQTAVNLCPDTIVGTVTDSKGCIDSVSVTISQPNSMTVSMSSTNVSCFGACDGVATVTVNGGQLPYTYSWDDPLFQTTFTADSLCADTVGPILYTVIVTDGNLCNIQASVLIFQPQQLSLTISSVDSSNCGNADGGACISVSGGVFPYTYQWNDPDLTQVSCIDSVLAGVYEATVIDNNFCFTTLLVPVNDVAGPVIDSIITVDDNCYGDSIGTAVGYATASFGPIEYIWMNAAGDTLNEGLPPWIGDDAVDTLGAGAYTLTVIDLGSGGLCQTSQVFAISRPAALNSAIFPSNITDASCNGLCDGDALVLVSGGTPPYTYSWSNGDVMPLADSLCPGISFVSIEDSLGCIDTSTATITEPAPILINPLVSDVSCFGGNDGGIGANVSGGTAPYAYVWLPPGTGGNVDTVTDLVADTFMVIVTDLNGCSETDSNIIVTEPTLMVITDSVIPATCGGANGIATVTPTGGTPGYIYLWSTSPPQTDSTATALLEGNYTVDVTDNNGCTETIPVFVSGTPTPVIDSVIVSDFNGTNVDCYGNSTGSATAFVSSGILPYTYSWSNGDITQTADSLSAGVYIVTITDSNGCQDIAIRTISEPDSLTLITFGDALICFGDSTQISVAFFGGTNPFVRSWCEGLSDSSQHMVSPDTSGCYQQVSPPPPPCRTVYCVVVTDANGCGAGDSVIINVNYPLLVTATGANICEGESATISVLVENGNGGPFYYWWYESDTTTLISNSSAITVSPLTSTSYIIVVSDSCSLNDTTSVLVSVNRLPEVNFFSDKSTGCTIAFTDTSKGYSSLYPDPSDTLIVSWFWDFGDGTLMGPNSGVVTGVPNTSGTYTNPVHVYGVPGTYDVTVTVTDVNGCSSTLTINSMITYVGPTAAFDPDPALTTTANTTIEFSDESSTPNGSIVSWEWDFDDGETSTDQNPSNSYPPETGTYSVMLIITDTDGCIDTVWETVTIEQEPVLYVPNVFSPDKQDASDKLYICGQKVESLFFIIYDRWGKKIWEYNADSQPLEATSDPVACGGKCCRTKEGWDGMRNGKKLAPQVLVYYLEATFEGGEEITRKGNITLIR